MHFKNTFLVSGELTLNASNAENWNTSAASEDSGIASDSTCSSPSSLSSSSMDEMENSHMKDVAAVGNRDDAEMESRPVSLGTDVTADGTRDPDDDPEMPALEPQTINEQAEANQPGTDENGEVGGIMPTLIAQAPLQEYSDFSDEDDHVSEDPSMEDDEDDVLEANERDLEAENIVTKKVRTVLTKENGVVILALEEAKEIFPTCCWCKKCDTFFKGIQELRSHLVIIHCLQTADFVTKHNEATWDLPIAQTLINPLDLE